MAYAGIVRRQCGAMMSAADEPRQPPSKPPPWFALAEVLLIFGVFFLDAGWPAPSENEAHYLAKAKHYWNPQWCVGDHFLESSDAHLVFYWAFGWVTQWLSLPATAWVGRILNWGLLAWAWHRLTWTLLARPLYGLLSAALFVFFSHHCRMAGEWVVGGVEAKSFAYVFLLLAVAEIARSRWNRAGLLLGIGSALHVLVGGWGFVAAGFGWLICGGYRDGWKSYLPGLLAGLLLALAGVLPAASLTYGVDPDVVHEANRITVFERLDHHLVIQTWHLAKISRHVALLVVWLLLCWCTPATLPRMRLRWFVAGAVVIALCGAAIDLATSNHEQLAATLLHFYWYRLSDTVLPVGAAMEIVGLIGGVASRNPAVGRKLILAAVVISGFSLATWNIQRRIDLRPGAVVQGQRIQAGRREEARQKYHDWKKVCAWIAQSTDQSDQFLTPYRNQTFKWYAGRSEVVTWKDFPQDAESILQWWRRLQEIHRESPYRWRKTLAELSELELFAFARKYQCRYVLVERSRRATAVGSDKQVYPQGSDRNANYVVYVVPPE